MPRSLRIGVAFAVMLAVSSATAEQTEASPAEERTESDDLAPSTGDRALATGAAVVPGVIVHGAGHYVLGDSGTAGKLLLAEGIGLGMVAVGGTGLFLTGASRYTVGPLAAISMFGVGVFSLSLIADVYGVATADQAPPARVAASGLRASRASSAIATCTLPPSRTGTFFSSASPSGSVTRASPRGRSFLCR